ncbi:MAG: gliding motility-associated peptidyl-prolyl isomerase GldI [Bacteroidetes bacterium]|nr:gliding motility-associated peptidyl-prolyl isomerase GldI [Bacteroidota bacterium]
MKNLIVLILAMLAYTSCKSPEARKPVSVKTGSIIDRSIAYNKKINSEQHELIKQIIQHNPDIKYIASQNGFWYYYNTSVKGDSIVPKFGDIVNFSYEVIDFNGNTIYSSDELKAQNYAMDQEELFTGLREGLKLMKAGETITFLFPSDKAYGHYGDENKIGANIPLICKVTINTITQKETN